MGDRHIPTDDARMYHLVRRSGVAAAIALALAVSTAVSLVAAQPASAADFPAGDAGYHTYGEMVTEIQAAHPRHRRAALDRQNYRAATCGCKVSTVATDEPERGHVRLAPPRAEPSRSSRRSRSCAG
jgi:hypothetical protein